MNAIVRTQLSVMMFLEFFVWGAWAVTLGTYLGNIGFSGTDIGYAYSTTGWAAIASPFFIGMIADRFFAAEKVMGVLHLAGAGLMYWATTVTDPTLFFWVLLLYALCYMPTLALVNAIAFNQMTDVSKEFPGIRVLGTIGWIAAGVAISFVLGRFVEGVDGTVLPLQLAAAASLVMGLFSFTLPSTPPTAKGEKVTVGHVLGLDALSLMKSFPYAVFVAASLLVCIPLAFYYTFANPFLNAVGMEDAAFKMSFGQMSEVVFMVILPIFLLRLGVKYMLLVGMLAWTLRYVLFAYGGVDDWTVVMLYGGIILHGICYDFFFVTGQIYVDKKAPHAIRASAQGFIALVTYGVGMVIGNNIAGRVVDAYSPEEGMADWTAIWMIPAAMAFVVAIAFFLLFWEKESSLETAEAAAPATEPAA